MGGPREAGTAKSRDATAHEADKSVDSSACGVAKSLEKSPSKSRASLTAFKGGEMAALVELERELQELDEYCRQHEIPLEEMQEALQPLVSAVNWSRTQQLARSALRVGVALVLLFGILCVICNQKPVRDAAFVSARVALVKLLPYWDWTDYYRQNCLVLNPLYESPGREERSGDTCQSCEMVSALERLSNVSSIEVTHNYLREDRPFVVTDATADWPAMQWGQFDRHDLIQLFRSESLHDTSPCELKTNLKIRDGMSGLLGKMSNPVVKKWFAQWENCDKAASKALRTLYRRPYFLPAMIDTSDPNWVAVSSNYTGHVYKMLPVVNDMVWMAQLQGTSQVRLLPRPPCDRLCAEVTDTLHTGEILTFTDYMWSLEYLPGFGTDNIIIGSGGYWQ